MAVQIKRGNEGAALITRTEEISTVVVAEIASMLQHTAGFLTARL